VSTAPTIRDAVAFCGATLPGSPMGSMSR
jgi:hypothetical protein